MIALYFSAAHHTDQAAGQVFNIGGGMAHSMSLLELFAWLNPPWTVVAVSEVTAA